MTDFTQAKADANEMLVALSRPQSFTTIPEATELICKSLLLAIAERAELAAKLTELLPKLQCDYDLGEPQIFKTGDAVEHEWDWECAEHRTDCHKCAIKNLLGIE